MWLGLLAVVASSLQLTPPHMPHTTTVSMRGYADAKAAAAERRAPSAPKPKEEPPVVVAASQEDPTTVAPGESVRKVLEVLGSRIGSNGRPLSKGELETFTKDVDRVIKGLN